MSRSSPYGILVVALSSVVVAVILFKWIPIWSWKTKPANPHHDVKLIVEEHHLRIEHSSLCSTGHQPCTPEALRSGGPIERLSLELGDVEPTRSALEALAGLRIGSLHVYDANEPQAIATTTPLAGEVVEALAQLDFDHLVLVHLEQPVDPLALRLARESCWSLGVEFGIPSVGETPVRSNPTRQALLQDCKFDAPLAAYITPGLEYLRIEGAAPFAAGLGRLAAGTGLTELELQGVEPKELAGFLTDAHELEWLVLTEIESYGDLSLLAADSRSLQIDLGAAPLQAIAELDTAPRLAGIMVTLKDFDSAAAFVQRMPESRLEELQRLRLVLPKGAPVEFWDHLAATTELERLHVESMAVTWDELRRFAADTSLRELVAELAEDERLKLASERDEFDHLERLEDDYHEVWYAGPEAPSVR